VQRLFLAAQTPRQFIEACGELNSVSTKYSTLLKRPDNADGDAAIREKLFSMPIDALVDMAAAAMKISEAAAHLVVAAIRADALDAAKGVAELVVEKVKAHDFSGAQQLLKAVLKRNPAVRRAIQDGLIALAKIAGFAKLLGAVTTGAGLFLTSSTIADDTHPYFALKDVEYAQMEAMRRIFPETPVESAKIARPTSGPVIAPKP
jgi:hypothetical protein